MTAARRPIAGMLIGLALGALAVVLLVSILQTRGLAGAIREQQQVNTGTVQLIEDCTKPSGKCFKRSQARTAAAVLDIGQTSVFAAACADEPGVQTADDIYACIMRKLDEQKGKR